MKIRNLSCTQFAGIRGRSVAFEDGMNVIYGKNESGKSTLVNLLSRLLFQNARVGLQSREDKAFRNLYLPGMRRGAAVSGDFADGSVIFETERGCYQLNKEWSTEPRCLLSTPDGVLRDTKTVEAVLKEALRYGEGVYSDLLFSSQRNTDAALQTILDATQKTNAKQEITNAVSRAFVESDGVSIDDMEQAIRQKIRELAGEHWDMAAEAPVRKAGGGRYKRDVGSVLEAYYALEDAQAVLEEITRLETEADRTAGIYSEKSAEVEEAAAEYERFSACTNRLVLRQAREAQQRRTATDLEKCRRILADWPVLEQKIEQVRTLQKEQETRILQERFEAAVKLQSEITVQDREMAARACPTDGELLQLRRANRRKQALESVLCDMNLQAVLRMLNGQQAEITLLRTGEKLSLDDGRAVLSEAVQITVPGVMELQLSPADVDVDAVKEELAECNREMAALLNRYQVKTPDELEGLSRCISEAQRNMERVNLRLSGLLGEWSFEALEAAVAELTDPARAAEAIRCDLFAICGSGDAAGFVAAKQEILRGYRAEYGTLDGLQERIAVLAAELERISETDETDLPQIYRDIRDPEAYGKCLRETLEQKRAGQIAARDSKITAETNLETYKNLHDVDPRDDVEYAKRKLEEKKALLKHWLHIETVFRAQKEQLREHPMEDIAARFIRNLEQLTAGHISSEFPEADRLELEIYSDDRLLDYAKLSEGTKETVSLAFRLAVLEHLFPEGGGVIVFDDPFTDLDAERLTCACKLVRTCAQRHQVIFLTCRKEYAEMLGATPICI